MRSGAFWTVVERRLLCDLYGSRGVSEIAAMLKRSVSAVNNQARKTGLKKKRFLTDDEKSRIRSLAPLKTSQQCAMLLGLSAHTVKGFARRNGVSFVKMGERHHSAEYSDDLVSMVRLRADNGEPVAAIAASLGIPYSTVYGWCSCWERTGIYLRS